MLKPSFNRFKIRGSLTPLLFLASFALYLTTLTQVHTFDALTYILDVDQKPWLQVFHPHHLAYGPVGKLVRYLGQFLGLQSAAIPLQITNALAGALGGSLFFTLIHKLTNRLDLALCGTILLNSSNAYWYYAVEVEVYTIATLFLIICLWLTTNLLKRPTRQTCLMLGVAQSFAVFFHQTNLLFCFPGTMALFLATPNQTLQQRSKLFLAYSLPLGLLVVGGYLFVWFGLQGLPSFPLFIDWLTLYLHTGWWGGSPTEQRFLRLGEGLAITLAQPNGGFLGLWLVGLITFALRKLFQTYRNLVFCLIGWLLVYGSFFFWWEPDNCEFWIASLPPFFLLLLLALKGSGPRWHPGVLITLLLSLTMLTTNYETITRRGNADSDSLRQTARALADQSKPIDLFFVTNDIQQLYLKYYEKRAKVISLNRSLFENKGVWGETCKHLQYQIDATLAQGGAFLFADALLHLQDAQLPAAAAPEPIFTRFRLTQADLQGCFAPYLPGLTPFPLPASLPLYSRFPSAQELAAGEGWNFTKGKWGWQGKKLIEEKVGQQGWDFLPGADPSLISPKLNLLASHYTTLELRIATSVAVKDRDLQLFFADERGLFAEARSLRRTLKGGQRATTYRIPLTDKPGWEGVVTGLRLDPVGAGDGGRIQIEGLRLLKE